MGLPTKVKPQEVARLGQLIAEARKAAGMDQEELAELVGCGRDVLSDWELGKVTRFQRAILLGIVRALGPGGAAIATEAVRLHILTVDATKLPALGWIGHPKAGDAPVTSERDSAAPSKAAVMLAAQIGQMIEDLVRSDEADKTRQGRETIAAALAAFAERFYDGRDNPAVVVNLLLAAERLRRGDI